MSEAEIFKEYARVIEMCEGTKVMSWQCVKFDGRTFTHRSGVAAQLSLNPEQRGNVTFAVAIVEDRPVWLYDFLYANGTDCKREVVELENFGNLIMQLGGSLKIVSSKNLSWYPPKPKTITVTIPVPMSYGHVRWADGSLNLYFKNTEDALVAYEVIMEKLKT